MDDRSIPTAPLDVEAPQDELLHAVNSINAGLIARDRAGIILFVNDRILQWLGYERDEMVGRSIDMCFTADMLDVLHEELKAVDEGDLRVRLSLLRRKDGTTFPILSVPQILTDRAECAIGGIAVIVDLGAVQTAKPAGYGKQGGLRATMNRIALQLQSLSITADVVPSGSAHLDHPELGELSPRETEVLAPLLNGERVPSIAKGLHISPHTVRNHLKSIFRKLGVGSQSELIQLIHSINQSS